MKTEARLDVSGIVWAIERDAFAHIQSTLLPAQMPSADEIAATGVPRTTRRGSTAVIPIKGIITKEADIFTWLFGGTATTAVAQELRKAVADSSVSDIQLLVDSPGGFAAGVGDLADEIRALRSQKPINAHVEDQGASAAYWIASAASSISATQNSDVGSIGVFSVAYDQSEMFEKAGVKGYLVTSGGKKGRGGYVAGIPIEDIDIEVLQKNVDTVNASFIKAVAAGRNMSAADVKPLNTGEVWRGTEAKKRGLVDQVLTPVASNQSGVQAALNADLLDGQHVQFLTPPATSTTSGGGVVASDVLSNTPAAMNRTEEESSMPDQPTPPATAAPDNRAEGRAADTPPAAPVKPAAQQPEPPKAPADNSTVLAAIGELKASFDERIKALESKETEKDNQALAAKKDEAIAFGLDEKIVDECTTMAEVERLVKVAKAAAPSDITLRRKPAAVDDETTQYLKTLDEGREQFLSSIAIGRSTA